jgi:hypothetical protein
MVLNCGAAVSAHRYDEVLQGSRIGVEPDRVHLELRLTSGIAVADAVVRDIDVNGDGVLSAMEQQAYGERVLHQLTLRVDDSAPLTLVVAESKFPDPAAMRGGDAAINLQIEATLPRLGGGAHRLSFRNDHATASSVYLANALIPDSPEVTVTGQRRDVDQRQLDIDFTLRGARLSLDGLGWIGFAGTLLLAAALTRRAETTPRGGRSRQRVENAASEAAFNTALAPVFTSGDMTASGNQP